MQNILLLSIRRWFMALAFDECYCAGWCPIQGADGMLLTNGQHAFPQIDGALSCPSTAKGHGMLLLSYSVRAPYIIRRGHFAYEQKVSPQATNETGTCMEPEIQGPKQSPMASVACWPTVPWASIL